MVQNHVNSNFTNQNTSGFQIEMNASVFTMLSKNVYNDVILAPLREWSTNAVDACIDANLPIKFDVHLPEMQDLTFSVRDYGTGLDTDDILGLFSTFGASTKRDSNKYNGTFGIGRMSGLAYANAFLVESFYHGTKHTYLISIKDGIPASAHMGSTPTTEANGLKLTLDVKPHDVNQFKQKAIKLYKHFDVKPTSINIEIPELAITVDDPDYMLTTEYNNGVVMGNVFYALDYSIPQNFSGLILKVPIGAVSITPGRESLNYDETTVNYLTETVKQAEIDLIANMNIAIQSKATIKEQLETFSVLHEQSPYKVRNTLIFPTTPNNALYSNANGYGVGFNHPDFEIVTKEQYYSSIRNFNNSRMSLSTFVNATFVIVDQRNYGTVAKSIKDTTVIILKARDNKKDEIELAVPKIEAFLAACGFEYTYISDYEVEKEKKAKVALGAGSISVKSQFAGNSFYSDKTINLTTDKIIYIPISKSTSSYSSIFLNTINKIHSKLLQADSTIPKIVGIQKKHIAEAEASPNCTELLDFYNNYLQTNPITLSDYETVDLYSYSRLRASAREHILTSSQVPDDLKEAFKEYKIIKEATKKVLIFSKDEITEVTTHIPFQLSNMQCRYNISDIYDKYPLLFELHHLEDNFKHYLKLEKVYNDSLHPTC